MDSAARTNAAFIQLAELTGAPSHKVEYILPGERMETALAKFAQNLAVCVESLNDKLAENSKEVV